MQAVVLMAGKGTRMAKHYDGPKHLLPVAGRPIVEHVLELLPAEITELVFVVGGPHETTIRDYFSQGEHQGRPITFVVQREQLGLAHAFKTARDVVSGRWLGMIGDDILGPEDLSHLVQQEIGLLAARTDHPENFGVLVADNAGNLVRSVEKPKEFVSDLVWTGHMVMDERFFEAEVPPSARGEYETPDVWMKLIADFNAKIKIIEADFWLPINDKDQLAQAEEVLGKKED
jgi:dTDP-glucose pyrophosphorylase